MFAVTGSFDFAFTVNVRRSGTLVHTDTFEYDLSGAGGGSSEHFPQADTFVDTAPSTTTESYTVNVVVTSATGVSSASATDVDINTIVFG
ncbi:MAG: hypothetical protein A2201_12640 [Alicyclobacillus sp. RIFOXYA1_FULL_53_8]|nr:MAG: hypothetical protein A2201_12640 [Alicyclobacillus sp. RIFOXYA1_FULL_53_8]